MTTMKINPAYVTFARQACSSMKTMRYGSTREGQLIFIGNLNADFYNRSVPKTISLVLYQGRVIMCTRPFVQNDPTPSYDVTLFQAIPPEKAMDDVDQTTGVLLGEATDSEIVDKICSTLQLALNGNS